MLIWISTKGDYERVSFYVAKIYQECRINTIAIFLTDSSRMTLPVGLTNFQSMYSIDYGRYGCRRRKRMIWFSKKRLLSLDRKSIGITDVYSVANGWLMISTINVAQLWKNIGIAFISVILSWIFLSPGISRR